MRVVQNKYIHMFNKIVLLLKKKKEDVVDYYSVVKKNEIIPSAATWRQLEIIILSEVRQRQISYDITYMRNLRYGTIEPTYETEADSQT